MRIEKSGVLVDIVKNVVRLQKTPVWQMFQHLDSSEYGERFSLERYAFVGI